MRILVLFLAVASGARFLTEVVRPIL